MDTDDPQPPLIPLEDCGSASTSTTPSQQEEQQHEQHDQHHHEPPSSSSSYHSLSYAYRTYLSHNEDEQNHWEDVCRAYRQYANFAMAQWANHQYRLLALPDAQRAVLPPGLRTDSPEFRHRTTAYKEAAIRNQFCLDCILLHAGQPHSQDKDGDNHRSPDDAQMSKVSSVLKSLVRDWSIEGRPERDLAYGPILQQLQAHVPIPGSSNGTPSPPRVCVPGAGVGRLALEISSLGYAAQGNEFSLYMLLASDFILNGGIATPETPLKVSPWLLETRNVHQWHDPLRSVQIPDVDPFALINNGSNGSSENTNNHNAATQGQGRGDGHDNDGDDIMASGPDREFSMAAGDFVSIYNTEREQGQWDAVVVCFFLDASPSIVEYLQVIHRMLKPGGVLLNFGPLLWHWSAPAMRPDDETVEAYQERYSYLDKKYLTSVDFCWEDIQEILVNVGFEIVEASSGNRALYTADQKSMMNMDYRCISFVARKKGASGPDGAPVHPLHPGELLQQAASNEGSVSN